ncbi:Exoenzymes regulatory protein AepA precursor [hydrothermal vent metagenome]|uniref:Exoenzymes regulatory protein AepA n=1 Tax=hydrothermal vent metagenome TaxID=652676 RepID=A0A3B0V6L2_9ZZZZ
MIKVKILLTIYILAFSFLSAAKVTIIHNIKGYTINQHKLVEFSTIAFEHGRILQIGTKDELSKLYTDAKLIDGQGRSLLPGLHDSHTDIMQAAEMSTQLDLRNTKSLDETLVKIQNYINAHPDKNWIEGYGWNHKIWANKQLPNNKDLDELETDKPIWLLSNDKQTGWANTKTMKITKAFKYKKQPRFGKILFDGNGKHTGIYISHGINIIQPHISRTSIPQEYRLFIKILKQLSSQGITSLDDSEIDNRTYNIYTGLARGGKLPIRVNAIISTAEKALDSLLAKGSYHEENQFLHIHTIKYYVDGNLDFHGAAMFEPYIDNKKSTGQIKQPIHFLKQDIPLHTANGWQVAIAAVGDRANNIALEVLLNENVKTTELRHRIEHATIISLTDFKRFKQSSLIVSIQPNFAIAELTILKKAIDRQRLKGAYAWQTLIKQGAILISGSNFPIVSANPFYGMHAAVTRKDRNASSRPWIPIERLTVKQALESYSINPAYANRQEDSLGSLEAGKWADFILIDQDIFTIKPDNIWQTKVLQTWVAGKKIYDRKEVQAQETIFKNTLEK